MKNKKNIKSKLTILIMLLTLTFFGIAFAGRTNDIINREILRHDKIVKEVMMNNNRFINQQKISLEKMQNHQEIIEVIKNKHMDRIKTSVDTKKAPPVIVFVSFSMPDLSLKQIIYDASRYQVPVVIRGLYKNSFRKTIDKIFEVVKENNKGGIAINPKWFKEYDIKAVPAVVVSDGIETKDGDKKSDIVYGNIPLKKALSIIADRGTTADIAKAILAKKKNNK